MPPALRTALDKIIELQAADVIFTHETSPIIKNEKGLVVVNEVKPLGDKELEEIVKTLLPAGKEKELEEQRQTDLAYAYSGERFRVNVFYQRGHLSVVMRWVRSRIRTLEELQLPEIIKDLLGNDNGLILMVGPTGSGKSTSLAAMVDHVNENFEKHIITIEDPVEYVYDNKKSIVEQREIGVDAVSFPAALRSALREAPDVILMGEMRDLESISTAVTVAETGHLVLSTVHANNAVGTIDRIIDIFPAEQKDQIRIQLADILIAVLNQRLVPLVDGSGARAFVEIMVANSAVRNAIRSANSAQLPNIIQTSAGDGMRLMDDLLVKAVQRNEITQDVALSFANDRAEMKKHLF